MNPTDQHRTKNALEWTVFGISLMIVLATLGMLVAAALRTQPGPAILQIKTGEPEIRNGQVIFPVTVINQGGEVAENVDVRVTLGQGTAMQEAGFKLDYIPRNGFRSGVVAFTARNEDLEPKSFIVGYSTP